jgi:predicted SprT family Zn-dependent metalloprotease
LSACYHFDSRGAKIIPHNFGPCQGVGQKYNKKYFLFCVAVLVYNCGMKRDRNILLLDLTKRAATIWEALAEIHPRLCGFDVPEIILNGRMWRTAGQCFQESRKVSISPKFYDAGFDARMNQIILPHELIHQADYDLFGQSEKKCGHGKNWSMLMVQYGLEPDKYHTMSITQQGTKKND